MQKSVSRFDSYADAERADRRYYSNLSPEERLAILLELVARYQESHDDAAKGRQRVYRIAQLGGR